MRRAAVLVVLGLFVVEIAAPLSTAGADPLLCQLQASRDQGALPLSVDFQGIAAGGRAPYSFAWTLGEGTTSQGSNFVHVYDRAGFFDAILTVTDSSQPQQTCRDTLQVAAGFAVDYYCLASADSTWSFAPLTVHFHGQPGFMPGPQPYTYLWGFGDGESSSEQAPVHTFAASGTYQARLRIRAADASEYPCHPAIRLASIPRAVATEPSTWAFVKRLFQ